MRKGKKRIDDDIIEIDLDSEEFDRKEPDAGEEPGQESDDGELATEESGQESDDKSKAEAVPEQEDRKSTRLNSSHWS